MGKLDLRFEFRMRFVRIFYIAQLTRIVAGVIKHHRIIQILLGFRPIISSLLQNKRRQPERELKNQFVLM